VAEERGTEFYRKSGRKGGERKGNTITGTKGGSRAQRRGKLVQKQK
jgi:hypothetical protein